MNRHTPGPWRLSYLGDTQGPVIQRGDEGGFVVLGRSVEQQDADARLIAVAPELLEMLEKCYEREWGYGSGPTHDEMVALIAKARGGKA